MLIIGLILALLIVFLLGETGMFILAAFAFGILFSTYFKVRILLEEVETIKKKLGIDTQGNSDKGFHVNNEEIEKELEEPFQNEMDDKEEK